MELAGASAVRDGGFGTGEDRQNAIGESEIEEHPLRDDASHFLRLEIDHEQGLLPFDLAGVGADGTLRE